MTRALNLTSTTIKVGTGKARGTSVNVAFRLPG